MNDNVIAFPGVYSSSAPPYERVLEAIESKKNDQIQDVSQIISDSVLETLVECGYEFPIGTDKQKAFFLVFECIKAMVMLYHDEEHVFHDLAKHAFEVQDEEGTFIFLSPNIKLKAREDS